MKTSGALAVALAAVAVNATGSPARIEARASSSGSSTLPVVTTKGNAFFQGKERFYIRGVDYQPGDASQTVDPLADPSICKRDIPYFKQLGLNTIRVYAVDNSANHDECMSALAEAGIYVVLDVNTPKYSLNRDDPAGSYNPFYLQSIFATIDMFSQYTNTLVFLSGNEVINAPNTTNAAPFVKAVTRDMKQYIGERGYRAIPCGYSAADVSQNQYLLAQYLDCGAAPARSDFYSINNYEWCDPSSLTTSGWDVLAEQYKNYSIPLFMSEYGCITNQRTFQETAALYKEPMTNSFSGGLVYEYSNQGNGYGLVNINGNKVTPIGSQFSDLEKELTGTSNPSGSGGYTTQNKPQECPGQSKDWDTKPFTGDALPATPSGAIKYFKNGAGKGPGLKGAGSQWESGGSSATASASAGAVTATYGNGQPGSTGTSSSSAAVRGTPMDLAPIAVCGVAVILSFVFGAAIF